jgi:hypothetical protein
MKCLIRGNPQTHISGSVRMHSNTSARSCQPVWEATTFNSCTSKAKLLNRNTNSKSSHKRCFMAGTNTKRRLIIMWMQKQYKKSWFCLRIQWYGYELCKSKNRVQLRARWWWNINVLETKGSYNIQHGKCNTHTRGNQMGEWWMRVCQHMTHHGGSVSGWYSKVYSA